MPPPSNPLRCLRNAIFWQPNATSKLKLNMVVHRGITSIELVVTAMLLMTVMTFVTSLSLRVNRVWQEIGYHRVAVAELSNQLEALTRMTPAAATAAIRELNASQWCSRTLDQPEISGEVSDDSLGTRIVLRINWKRRYPAQPIELTGWLTESDGGESSAKKVATESPGDRP